MIKATEKPDTVVSDLFPSEISRTKYYEELGSGYLDNDQPEKALELFRLAILHDPKNIEARILLADLYKKQGSTYLAEQQLSEVIQQQPNHKIAMHKLGELYLSVQVYSKAKVIYSNLNLLDQKDDQANWALYFISKLEKEFGTALNKLNFMETSLNADSKIYQQIILEKASLYRLQNMFQQEQLVLEQAYGSKPNFQPYVIYLADSYIRSKKWDQVFKILQRYTITNDFNFEISEMLSQASIQEKKYEVALNEFSKQKNARPEIELYSLKIAHMRFLMKDYALAEAQYELCLQSKESDEATYYLSKIYQLTNRFDDSKKLLNKIPINSEYYGASQVESANFENEKNPGSAVKFLSMAHKNRPDSLVIYKAYSDLLIANNQFSEAIDLLIEGINAFRNDEDLRLKIAYSFYQVGNKISFDEQMHEAIQINPNNSEIYSVLGQLWFHRSKKSLEIDYIAKKALELKGKNLSIRPLLAWTLLDKNKSSEVISLFEEFYEKNSDDYFYVKSLADLYSHTFINNKAQEFSKNAQIIQSKDALHYILQNSNEEFSTRLPASLDSF
ncbi:MAG: tetratricopeptide repeat protein [Pseudobdellovibrio sp.]